MREFLIKLFLDRMLPDARPDEEFFAAGPRAVSIGSTVVGRRGERHAPASRQHAAT